MVTGVTQALGLFTDFHQTQGIFTVEWDYDIADDVAGMIY
jgi:hypothetical protein